MRVTTVAFLVVVLSGNLNFCFAQDVSDDAHEWSSSYEFFRKSFKKLPSTEINKCESLLKDILNDLDIKNQCRDDNDCVLIEQEPFGNTVPYPKVLSDSMETRMKSYYEQCAGRELQSFTNKDLMHEPVCRQNKCKVSTSLKK